VFDTPGAIESQLKDWFGPSYTSSSNSLLYSIYSWPNTVLALFGGFIVDRITGVRLGALIFCGLIWLGQFVFALGVQSKSYPICVLGRFLFGLGGESLTVVQNTFVIRWFSGPYMALVFGLVLAFARVGSSVNFAVTPTLTDQGVPFSVWFGVGMCTISLIMCILLVILDYCSKHYVEKPEREVGATMVTNSPGSLQDEEANRIALGLEEEHDEQLPSLLHIAQFPKSAWFLFLVCCFFYQGVLTFYQVASDIMQNTGNRYDPNTASLFVSIPSFVSIIASPLFGSLVDNVGKALNFILIASWGLMFCHIAFLALAFKIIVISPVPIMLFIGIFYALGAASIWPILALIIPKHMVSTGYGTMTAIQNLGLAVFPLVISAVQTTPGISGTTWQYGVPIFIFIACVAFAALLTVQLVWWDTPGEVGGTEGRLNASAEERAEMEKDK
jgi:MFS family permease